MSSADDTARNNVIGKPFKPGQSGNPKGRPKGARSKLGEAFCQDVLTEWEKHGAVAISDMREKNPGDFVKVVASMLPKEMNLRVGEFDDLSDDELARELASLAKQLAASGEAGKGVAEAFSAIAGKAKSTGVH